MCTTFAALIDHAARLPALQAALLSEREEAKLAVALEKQALEEARTARVKVGPTANSCFGCIVVADSQPATHYTSSYSTHSAMRQLT
jgi:hypothetical protein